MRLLLVALGVLALAVLSGPAEALPLPVEPSVCFPDHNGLCATCGFIGFNHGFHMDTMLLCL